MHLKNDRQNLSFVEDCHAVDGKMAECGKKGPFMSHKFSELFFQNWKKNGNR